MQISWTEELLGQAEFYWEQHLRPRLVGLTDAEYLWEPVPGCWSVRPQPDGTTTIDWDHPAPDPPPVTTIAWRLCHVAGTVLAWRRSNHFGDGTWTPARTDWPATADGAVSYLERELTSWCAAVRAAGIERLEQRAGEAEGPWAEHSFATLVLHLNRELIHHGAEIGVLRDLYRTQGLG